MRDLLPLGRVRKRGRLVVVGALTDGCVRRFQVEPGLDTELGCALEYKYFVRPLGCVPLRFRKTSKLFCFCTYFVHTAC